MDPNDLTEEQREEKEAQRRGVLYDELELLRAEYGTENFRLMTRVLLEDVDAAVVAATEAAKP